jgi:UDP-N-acetylmuramoyl-L-alanyl-D-glutamate--2,6-diaminopimelate ligase
MPRIDGPAREPRTGVPRPARVRPRSLAELAARVQARTSTPDVAVSGVSATSGRIRPGDLFAALPGQSGHGARFAAEALGRGAVAVLTDPAGAALLGDTVPTLHVPDARASLGPVSSCVYGDPSRVLRVLGVTGTSGKTTTTYFVHAGLQAAGRQAALMGTVQTLVGDEVVHTGFTTPEAPDVQALLAVMAERGARELAMEVSSHALAMGRVDGTEFALAAFTNLSPEHLDFHTDMEGYFAAKARLFDGRAERAVVVVDDEWGRRMARRAGPDALTVSTADVPGASWQVGDVRVDADGASTFSIAGPGIQLRASCAVPGRYNVANAALALAVLHARGVPLEVAVPAVAAATVPGRMERVEAGQQFLAVVDYSHKPAAVDGALRALRPLTRGRLIVVLGCGGDRDRAKRPLMGETAARGSQLLIVTDDNPRSEPPARIRQEMLAGARAVPAGERGEVREIGDRAEAIAAAVAAAGPGDTVLVAGKGHETGQEIAGVVHPFEDRQVLRRALESRS